MRQRQISDPEHHTPFTQPTEEPTVSPSAFFNEELWAPRNVREFTLFAARLMRRRGVRRADKDAADYVSDAKVLLLSGERTYTARYSPKRCVYATIASIVFHAGNGSENRLRAGGADTLDEEILPADTPSIEDTVAAREYLDEYKSNFSDEAHRRYLDLMAEGYVPAADAAKNLDVSESDIWRIRKNLRRPRKKWPGKPPVN